MGRPPRELTPQESTLHFFGAELRHWRTVRELSQAKLGRRTHDSGALISKIEKAERYPSLAFARRMDQALATGGALERLWPQVSHERAIRTAPASTPLDSGEPLPVDLGLGWSATPAATVEVVGKLWRADVQRRSVLLSAAWVASAFAEPIHQWLLNRQDEVRQDRPGRHVGQSDID
ncbi:MAG: helix-turn-helix domain-containing protein, partial [Pseudonocardiaceae bacterium]